MDVQNIDLRRKDFEASHPTAKTFIFNEETMLYSGPKVETLNGQWTTWCACIGIMHFEGLEAQTIPEGFVLVPKSEITDWYLDESDSMYLEEMDHWACEIDIGEVITVECKKVWSVADQYLAKVYVDEDNIEWQLFDDEASAQKAADHCKAMIEAAEDSQ